MKLVPALLCCVVLAGVASAQDVFYFSDFEADTGGWKASANWDPYGDWEWGKYDPASYVGPGVPPPTVPSGQNLWGTVLHDGYTNSGAESFLKQTFDFSGWSDMQMTWDNFCNVFYTWDTSKILVNGTEVWDYGTYSASPVWEKKSVDLSAYDGMSSVEITWQLHASTVVNYSGWYIDDVTITGVPEPTSLALLVLGGIGLLRRR